MYGVTDKAGDFTGPDIAYIYPDNSTALLGHFYKGHMVKTTLLNFDISSIPTTTLNFSNIEIGQSKGSLGCITKMQHLSDQGSKIQ